MDFGRRTGSYYDILGVGSDSSLEDIRRAYRKLAMRWHPDKWARNPGLLGEAKHRFQLIQEAYSVLSDSGKRTLYDAGLYNPEEDDDEEEEGFSDFVREMVSMMAKVKREERAYSLQELQGMFTEMSKGFEPPQSSWYYATSNQEASVFNSSSFPENNNHSAPPTKKARWGVGS